MEAASRSGSAVVSAHVMMPRLGALPSLPAIVDAADGRSASDLEAKHQAMFWLSAANISLPPTRALEASRKADHAACARTDSSCSHFVGIALLVSPARAHRSAGGPEIPAARTMKANIQPAALCGPPAKSSAMPVPHWLRTRSLCTACGRAESATLPRRSRRPGIDHPADRCPPDRRSGDTRD